jgi:hypothetical protein
MGEGEPPSPTLRPLPGRSEFTLQYRIQNAPAANLHFFGAKWHSLRSLTFQGPPLSMALEMDFPPTKSLHPTTLAAFSGPKKVFIFRPPSPSKMALVMDLSPLKPLRTAPYKQQDRYINS